MVKISPRIRGPGQCGRVVGGGPSSHLALSLFIWAQRRSQRARYQQSCFRACGFVAWQWMPKIMNTTISMSQTILNKTRSLDRNRKLTTIGYVQSLAPAPSSYPPVFSRASRRSFSESASIRLFREEMRYRHQACGVGLHLRTQSKKAYSMEKKRRSQINYTSRKELRENGKST